MATRPEPWTDEVVEEVRRARETLLKEFDYDFEKLGAWLQEYQQQFGDRLVKTPPPKSED